MFPKIDMHFASGERCQQVPSAQMKARSRAFAPQIFGGILFAKPRGAHSSF
jgi:hypothetical protein